MADFMTSALLNSISQRLQGVGNSYLDEQDRQRKLAEQVRMWLLSQGTPTIDETITENQRILGTEDRASLPIQSPQSISVPPKPISPLTPTDKLSLFSKESSARPIDLRNTPMPIETTSATPDKISLIKNIMTSKNVSRTPLMSEITQQVKSGDVPGFKINPKEEYIDRPKLVMNRRTGKGEPLTVNGVIQMETVKKGTPYKIEQYGVTPTGIGDITNKQYQVERDLADRFVKQAGDFPKVRDAYLRVKSSAVDPSAAGDLSLIFNYMKILDPGSVVREGEFATAANTASVPDVVRAKYNKVISGERLADSTRADFLDRTERLYASSQKQYEQIVNEYKKKAISYGVNPDRVITDLSAYDKPVTNNVAPNNIKEVERDVDGKIAVYDSNTKQFLRWK